MIVTQVLDLLAMLAKIPRGILCPTSRGLCLRIVQHIVLAMDGVRDRFRTEAELYIDVN